MIFVHCPAQMSSYVQVIIKCPTITEAVVVNENIGCQVPLNNAN